MRLLDPVLRENRLQAMHDGSFEAYPRVAPVVRVRTVAEPLVGDPVTERVADLAVEDEQLAMRAVIEAAEVPPMRLAVGGELDTVALEPLQLLRIGARAAEAVDQNPDLHAGARLRAQCIDELPLQLTSRPYECLEMHAVLRCVDVREHCGKDRAVLENLGGISLMHGALGEAGDQRQAFADLGVILGLELQVRRTAGARKEEEDAAGERGDDGRNAYP